MSAMLEIRDEGATGKLVQSFLLELKWDVTTVREVIRARVEHEVAKFNARQEDAPFNGLVQPRDAKQVHDGFRVGKM